MTLIELLIVVVIMPIVVGGIAIAIIRYPSERDDDFQSDRRQCRCPEHHRPFSYVMSEAHLP